MISKCLAVILIISGVTIYNNNPKCEINVNNAAKKQKNTKNSSDKSSTNKNEDELQNSNKNIEKEMGEDESANIFIDEDLSLDTEFLVNYEQTDFRTVKSSINPKLSNFVKIEKSPGESFYVRKSSIIWMLETEKKRVSSDRIYRFIGDKKERPIDEAHLFVGQFAKFVHIKKEVICNVLGFFFLTGNSTYKSEYCPIVQEDESKRRGMGVHGSFYTLDENKILKRYLSIDCIDLQYFSGHVKVKIVNNKLTVIE